MVFNFGDLRVGDKKRILLTGDWHIGHSMTQTQIIKKEMEGADYILIGGDWGNFIGHQDFKRYATVQNHYSVDEWIDATIEETLALCKGHESKIIGIMWGNHEYEVRRRHGVDPTQRLIQMLKVNGAKNILSLGFDGYIVFSGIVRQSSNIATKLWYCHGHGGASERTRGKLDWDIYYSRHEADVYWLGHKHQKDLDEVQIDRLNNKNTYERGLKIGIRTGSYKIEGEVDWSKVKFKTSEAIGGAYLDLDVARIRSENMDKNCFIPTVAFCPVNKALYASC